MIKKNIKKCQNPGITPVLGNNQCWLKVPKYLYMDNFIHTGTKHLLSCMKTRGYLF